MEIRYILSRCKHTFLNFNHMVTWHFYIEFFSLTFQYLSSNKKCISYMGNPCNIDDFCPSVKQQKNRYAFSFSTDNVQW